MQFKTTKLFPYGHAAHPQWHMAAALVLAQLRAQMALPGYAAAPTLALLYITDHYAAHAQDILDHLSAEFPEVPDWSGTVGVGIAASNVEYFDEPALAVMLCELPHDQYRVFSGVSPLPPVSRFKAHTALVHADAVTPDLSELIAEMANRTGSGYIFGGLASGRFGAVQFALSGYGNVKGQGAAGGVFSGGLSGVAFARGGMAMLSRVTQGCRPISGNRVITACEGNLVTQLDGQPALEVMLTELGIALDKSRATLTKLRHTLVGLSHPHDRLHDIHLRHTGQFGAEVVVRHIVGLDLARQGIALAQAPTVGMMLAFCERSREAARADLIRVCAEIREELESEETVHTANSASNAAQTEPAIHAARRIAGAIYVSCSGRGGPHFGAPSAELQIVRHALGDVPLVGFFAEGEIARHHLYGYTGVLTVFVQ